MSASVVAGQYSMIGSREKPRTEDRVRAAFGEGSVVADSAEREVSNEYTTWRGSHLRCGDIVDGCRPEESDQEAKDEETASVRRKGGAEGESCVEDARDDVDESPTEHLAHRSPYEWTCCEAEAGRVQRHVSRAAGEVSLI